MSILFRSSLTHIPVRRPRSLTFSIRTQPSLVPSTHLIRLQRSEMSQSYLASLRDEGAMLRQQASALRPDLFSEGFRHTTHKSLQGKAKI
jgi:hypothetical protein